MTTQFLLSPVIGILNRLRFSYKFILISMMFLLPILVMSTELVLEHNQKIQTIQNRQLALNYLAALRPLSEQIAQTRGMTNAFLNGKVKLESKIMDKRSSVDAKLGLLTEIDTRLGATYETDNRVARIKNIWGKLKRSAFVNEPATTFAEYTGLIDSILALMVHVSASSGLILSENLDTFYLTDSLVNVIPQTAEIIGKSRGLGSGIAAKKQISDAKKVKLTGFINSVIATRKRMHYGFDVALNDNQQLAESLTDSLAKASAATSEFVNLSKAELTEASEIKIEESDYFQAGTNAISANLELYDLILPVINDVYRQRIEQARGERLYLMLAIGLIIVACFYVFVGFYHAIMQSINSMVISVDQISRGDLTVSIEGDSKDEMSRIRIHINSMVEKFRDLVAQVVTAAEQVVEVSEKTSKISAQTTDEILQQNREIEQVAAAIEEMSLKIQDVAMNTSKAADETSNANTVTETGQGIVNQTIDSISKLSEEMGQACSVIKVLETNSSEIDTILNVIRGIAEQTNLLALNAAIEAARAGEQGRGFAVVADEVRTLAGRTQESTLEIQSIIERLQQGAANAVKVIEQGVSTTDDTVDKAHNAGSSLETLAETVSRIKSTNIQVASAVEEQSSVAKEVNRSVLHIRDGCIRNQEGSSETSRTSETLFETANNLRTLMNEFKVS